MEFALSDKASRTLSFMATITGMSTRTATSFAATRTTATVLVPNHRHTVERPRTINATLPQPSPALAITKPTPQPSGTVTPFVCGHKRNPPTGSVHALPRRPIMIRYILTIQEKDINQTTVRRGKDTYYLGPMLGRVQPQDVGKRVSNVDGVFQIESDKQFQARQKKEAQS